MNSGLPVFQQLSGHVEESVFLVKRIVFLGEVVSLQRSDVLGQEDDMEGAKGQH